MLCRSAKLFMEALAQSLSQGRCTRSVLRVPLPSPHQQHISSLGSGVSAGLLREHSLYPICSSHRLHPNLAPPPPISFGCSRASSLSVIFIYSYLGSLNHHLERVLQLCFPSIPVLYLPGLPKASATLLMFNLPTNPLDFSIRALRHQQNQQPYAALQTHT